MQVMNGCNQLQEVKSWTCYGAVTGHLDYCKCLMVDPVVKMRDLLAKHPPENYKAIAAIAEYDRCLFDNSLTIYDIDTNERISVRHKTCLSSSNITVMQQHVNDQR